MRPPTQLTRKPAKIVPAGESGRRDSFPRGSRSAGAMWLVHAEPSQYRRVSCMLGCGYQPAAAAFLVSLVSLLIFAPRRRFVGSVDRAAGTTQRNAGAADGAEPPRPANVAGGGSGCGQTARR